MTAADDAATLAEKLTGYYRPAGLVAPAGGAGPKLLTVRQPGILGIISPDAKVLDGCPSIVRPGSTGPSSPACPEAPPQSKKKLKVGEQVYVNTILLDPSLEKVSLYLTACGPCRPGAHQPVFRSLLVFELARGFVGESGADAVIQSIDGIVSAEAPAADPLAPSAAAPEQPAATPVSAPPAGPDPPGPGQTTPPVPPPAVDPSAPAPQPAAPSPHAAETPAPIPIPPPQSVALTLKKGQTPDEVEKVLGSPQVIFDLASKLVYVYPNFRIVFVGRKLADVF